MLSNYIKRQDYLSYDDLFENFSIEVPGNFNFAYDVVDKLAAEDPNRLAMVWCDDNGGEERFNFAQMKYFSDKAANFFK
jgi:acetyl-CoA synthetase